MDSIRIAKAKEWLSLPLARANRHGLIAGATGTGKTVTLRVMAEAFSKLGVPSFMADVKGDLAGICQPGGAQPKIEERARALGVEDFAYEGLPTVFWDLMGQNGHPIRATVSEMGPVLIGRILELNDTQTGVLHLAFKVADDNGLLLIDLKDLRALLQYVADNAAQLTVTYGNVAAATIGTIQRALLTLQSQGGDKFFGEPSIDFADFMRRDGRGRGIVSVLAAENLMMRPRLYATFLLWLLAELFERLPEEGDLDQPKLVFFFDEAHLLFNDAPPSLVERIEQMVRLIRSKGVGVYFVTQNPADLPDTVLGQLGNRVQHALRAFTPKEQRAIRTAAETFRPNPAIDTARVMTELTVGEALVSLLDEKGAPGMVERALVAPPRSRLGAITPDERAAIMRMSPIVGKYEQSEDRISAFEQLGGPQRQAAAEAQRAQLRAQTQAAGPAGAPAGQPPAAPAQGGFLSTIGTLLGSSTPAPGTRSPRTNLGQSIARSVAINLTGTITRQVANQIWRGIFGTIRRS